MGHVVATKGDFLIVEHGAIFKSRHALPREFAHVDDADGVVRATVSKEILADSPKLDDDEVNEQAVAAYYGLAGGTPAPETAGYGDLEPTDPARSAEVQGTQADIESPVEERARMRESLRPEHETPGEGQGGRQIMLGERIETKE
jgi:hypothetical protein